MLPGRRHEQAHGLPHVAAGSDQELERVVEQRRVGAARVERRRQGVVAAQRTFAGLHPCDVSRDRVDLAVVAEQPERLRALPARLRVRGEALVEHGPRDCIRGIGEIGVERGQLGCGAQSLVGDGAEGQRRDVHTRDQLRPPARARRAELRVRMRARGEQELHDAGHARGRRRAERSDVVRHLAPPRGFEALRPAGLLHDVLQPGLTQEAHCDAGTRLPRQRRSERQQHAGAVTRDAVRRPRATVGHSSRARRDSGPAARATHDHGRPQRGRCHRHRAPPPGRTGGAGRPRGVVWCCSSRLPCLAHRLTLPPGGSSASRRGGRRGKAD